MAILVAGRVAGRQAGRPVGRHDDRGIWCECKSIEEGFNEPIGNHEMITRA